jgi:hypothetical protein
LATVQPELPPVEVGVGAEEVEERVEVEVVEVEVVEVEVIEVEVDVLLALVEEGAEQSSAAARATMAGLRDLGSTAKMAADS